MARIVDQLFGAVLWLLLCTYQVEAFSAVRYGEFVWSSLEPNTLVPKSFSSVDFVDEYSNDSVPTISFTVTSSHLF
jgi:hypothetical protein